MGTGPSSPSKKGHSPQFSAHVYCTWPNGCVYQDAGLHALGTEVALSLGDIVLGGAQLLLPYRGTASPNFRPMSVVANGWIEYDATWNGGRHRLRRLCVRWGHSFLQKKGTAPTQFLAHVYCAQTAGWIKMPLGTEVYSAHATLCYRRGPSSPPL